MSSTAPEGVLYYLNMLREMINIIKITDEFSQGVL